jgi:hypothetical protein
MTNINNHYIRGPVMFWTVLTTVFTWLPLARIIGRADGYHWSILGLSGEGLSGPFWVFIPLTVFAVGLLFTAARGPRAFFYPMLILWHLTVSAVVIAAVVQGGQQAFWQGQALHLKIPLWTLAAPAVLFTAMAVVLVAVDRKRPVPRLADWSRNNTLKLAASLLLLMVAIVLFRLGTNYNWVTTLAVIIAIAHWITLAWSFESADEKLSGGAAAITEKDVEEKGSTLLP